MVEIRIIHNNKYHILEVGSKEFVRFTYQRYDLQDIQSFSSSFSQTIELEGNNNNISVLENITSLDVYRDITNLDNEIFINKKFNCVYIINDFNFEGLLTIQNVRKIKGTGEIVIECDIRSLEINISELLGDKVLRSQNGNIEDLDLSELKHELTLANIKDTWDNYDSQAYYYPIINYKNIQTPEIYLSDLRPALKAKYLIDKIFEGVGLEYDSNFLNSNEFKDIIHPWTDRTSLASEDLEERKFSVGLTDNTTRVYAGLNFLTTRQILPFNNENELDGFFDNGNNFDILNHKNIINNRGIYSFNLSGEFSTGFRVFNGQQIYLFDSNPINNKHEVQFELVRERGNEIKIIETFYQNWFNNFNSFLPLVEVSPTTWEYDTLPVYFNFTSSPIELNQGDKIYIRYRFKYNTNIFNLIGQRVTANGFIGFNKLNENGTYTLFSNNPQSASQFYLGDVISPKDGIPDNIKQIDYLKSVLKHFNMVIKVDKFNTNKYIIEPYDVLLASGDTLNWTSKLDKDSEISIGRMEEYLDKNILLEYKTDNNFYNVDYNELYKINYGSFRVNNNEIRTEEDYKIESIFHGTPGYYIPNSNVVIPQLYNLRDDESVNESVLGMRMLYRVLIDTNSSDYFNYARIPNFTLRFLDDEDSELYFLSNNLVNVENNVVNTAHHFSNPIKMGVSNDLNFGFQNIYYHHIDTQLPTNNNIYYRFWKNTIDRINNPNSQYVICKLYLNVIDIFNLDLDNEVVIEENKYIVNRILNWYDGEVCEVELIKV